MTYMTTSQAAKKWKLTPSRVYILARNGRIPGSVQIGTRWMIPENAEKPIDGRTKVWKQAQSEQAEQKDPFRYPDFAFRDPASFDPPLSSEELQLQAAEEAFHACRFEEAEHLVGDLLRKTKNKILRIYALYMSCQIDFLDGFVYSFFDHYNALTAEMKEDFPHKQEMTFILLELNAFLGAYGYFRESFSDRSAYDYHESFLPHLAALSAVSFSFSEVGKLDSGTLLSCELNGIFLKHSGCRTDLQTLHLYLGMAFSLLGKEKEAETQLRQVLVLAEQYDLYYIPAVEYYFMKDRYTSLLREFPAKVTDRLEYSGEKIMRSYRYFMDALSKHHIFCMLDSDDFPYVFYTVQGYTNKEIAKLLHKQLSTVGMHFTSMYNKLGIGSKKELAALYEKSVNAVPLP